MNSTLSIPYAQLDRITDKTLDDTGQRLKLLSFTVMGAQINFVRCPLDKFNELKLEPGMTGELNLAVEPRCISSNHSSFVNTLFSPTTFLGFKTTQKK